MAKKPTAQAKGRSKKAANDTMKARTTVNEDGSQSYSRRGIVKGKSSGLPHGALEKMPEKAQKRVITAIAKSSVDTTTSLQKKAIRNKTPGGKKKK
jgi:hypothetical protein